MFFLECSLPRKRWFILAIYVNAVSTLSELKALFPNVPSTQVQNALDAVSGDVNKAADILLQQTTTGLYNASDRQFTALSNW